MAQNNGDIVKVPCDTFWVEAVSGEMNTDLVGADAGEQRGEHVVFQLRGQELDPVPHTQQQAGLTLTHLTQVHVQQHTGPPQSLFVCI